MAILIEQMNDLKRELDYIKENMVKKDEVMNFSEFESYRKSFKKENLVSLEDAKKELGL